MRKENTGLNSLGMIGGIAGEVQGDAKIYKCINLGEIYSTECSEIGGIVGFNMYGGNEKNCYNTANIVGKNNNRKSNIALSLTEVG